ncbi:MAG: response regulator [Isosphaeraceae bacterium]
MVKHPPHRLLLVEDHPATRNVLRRLLTMRGWDVLEATTIAEGLARLDPPPECLVLDLMLPDGDGETILRKVRDDCLPTRVVVNTGTHDPDRLSAVSELKPEALLQKPIDIEQLCQVCEVPTTP